MYTYRNSYGHRKEKKKDHALQIKFAPKIIFKKYSTAKSNILFRFYTFFQSNFIYNINYNMIPLLFNEIDLIIEKII